MKRLFSFVVLAGLTFGGLSMAGCQSGNSTPRDHNELFGVGNGEFGTTTAIAGDYPSDLQQSPPAQQQTSDAH